MTRTFRRVAFAVIFTAAISSAHRGAPIPQQLVFTSYRATGIYDIGDTGRNNGLYAVGAAVAPTKILLATPRPSDFDSFWSEKLAAQAKVPINPLPMLESEDNNLTPQKEQNWDARSKEVLGILLNGGEFKPGELR